jgi:diamine N-acetyltransferase
MTDIQIKKVNLKEIYQLQKICRTTFYETFAKGNSEENMSQYLEEGFSIEKLSNELLDLNSAFYFASMGDVVVGYLKINFGESQTEIQDDKGLEIERIYVLNQFHGKNVGQLLFYHALKIAKYHHLQYIWLGVWEENQKAINFYRKNGFQEFDKHIFRLGDEEQIDIMMKLKLEND